MHLFIDQVYLDEVIKIDNKHYYLKKDEYFSNFNDIRELNQYLCDHVLPGTIIKRDNSSSLYIRTDSSKDKVVLLNNGLSGDLNIGSFSVIRSFDLPISTLCVTMKDLRSKLQCIKDIKLLTGWDLKEAKDYCDLATSMFNTKDIPVNIPNNCDLKDIFTLSKKCETLSFKIILQDGTELRFNNNKQIQE